MRRQGRRGRPESGCFVLFVSWVMPCSLIVAPAQVQAMEGSLAATRFTGISVA
jgi:hypothetical protein